MVKRKARARRKARSFDNRGPAIDRPTDERAQHDKIEYGDRIVFHDDGRTERTYGARVTTQRIIDRYRVNGLIDVREWIAADRFYRDCYTAQRGARLVANMTGAGGGGGNSDPTAAQEHARRERDAALAALPTMLRQFAVSVIRDDVPASVLCAQGGEKRAKIEGLVLLRLALDILVEHYKIEEGAKA